MDIVARLRSCDGCRSGDPDCLCKEAADEIERLRQLLASKIERVAAEDIRLYGSGFAVTK